MPSSEPNTLDADRRNTLIRVARQSIEHGLSESRPLKINPTDYDRGLQAKRASFVTLHKDGQLRGCIGHLEAVQALVVDIADNAYAAAFRDPRFSPLDTSEWPRVRLSLSVLSTPEPMQFDDEADLIRQLRPGEDGLILREGTKRGTFLPSVWESLRDPMAFLAQLKLKAGLASNHWSENLEVSRYRSESFSEPDTT